MAMCDAACRKCGKKIGWAGDPKDQPKCPKCGAPPDLADIAHNQAIFAQAKEMLAAKDAFTKSGKAEAVAVEDWLPGTTVYVGRAGVNSGSAVYGGLFGNPFGTKPGSKAVVIVGSINEAVELYAAWLKGSPEAAALLPEEFAEIREKILATLPELKGKRLSCWRHPGRCHAQILADMVNALDDAPASLNTPEPMPKPSEHPACWDKACQDWMSGYQGGQLESYNAIIGMFRERDAMGAKKYGQRLVPFDGRNSLVDMLQELADAYVYGVKAEMEGVELYREVMPDVRRLIFSIYNLIQIRNEKS